MALYKPPTKVVSISVPFKTLVVRADPDFERAKHNEVMYEMSNGRLFRGDSDRLGPYSGTWDNP